MTQQFTKQVTVESIDAQTLFAQFELIKQLIEANKASQTKDYITGELLTREEVAKLLKISLPTLHDWTNKGILRSYRVGNLIRYKIEEVMVALVPVMKYNYKSRKSN